MSAAVDHLFSFVWNNPYNMYAPVSGKTSLEQSLVHQVEWLGFTGATYALGYAMVGAEASYVSAYAMPYALAGGVHGTLFALGAMSAFAMAYHVHTDPVAERALSRGLAIQNTSNRDIMKTMTLGSVV
jgi:hypothetical protein